MRLEGSTCEPSPQGDGLSIRSTRFCESSFTLVPGDAEEPPPCPLDTESEPVLGAAVVVGHWAGRPVVSGGPWRKRVPAWPRHRAPEISNQNWKRTAQELANGGAGQAAAVVLDVGMKLTRFDAATRSEADLPRQDRRRPLAHDCEHRQRAPA